MVDKHSQKTMMTKVKLAVMLGLSTGLLAAISGTTLPVFRWWKWGPTIVLIRKYR